MYGTTDPGDLTDRENWAGGDYDLWAVLAKPDDGGLERLLQALWRHAQVDGCFHAPLQGRVVETTLALASLRAGPLAGTVRLPTGSRVICAAHEIASKGISFSLPLGALGRVEDRIGGFPFGNDGGPSSLPWRRPIDDWLAEVAQGTHEDVPLRFGLIGFDAVGEVKPDKFEVTPPDERPFGYLVPDHHQLSYFPATF